MRDPENLTLEGMRLTEASLFAAKPSSFLCQVVQAVMHIRPSVLADRLVGRDDPQWFACIFQRENFGFHPDSLNDTFGEALIEDG